MMRANGATVYAAVVLAAMLPACLSEAADMTQLGPAPTPVETSSGWTYAISPYAWAPGISGNVGVGRLPEVHFDADFGDIWQNLDFAAMVMGEARYDRYSVIGDLIYIKLSDDKGTPRGIIANNVEDTFKAFTGFLGGGYALVYAPNGHLDIVGGARVWSVDNTISFNGGLLDGASAGRTKTWVDAMAGLKGNYFFTPQVYATGWGLVGGGGADIDWDVGAALGYKFNKTISAELGYRAMGVDYSSDNFTVDVVLQGPVLGVTFRF